MPLRPRSLARLPGRYRFDEIARLVDVGALYAGHVIGPQLDRHRIDQRRDQWMGLGQLDRGEAPLASLVQLFAVSDQRDLAAARADFLYLADRFLEERARSCPVDHRDRPADQRDGPFEPEGADFARTSPC
ncbi:MAG: hypothetical protein RL702_3064 [Pseudomonadota bacterium]|jgi:hypothetical protein